MPREPGVTLVATNEVPVRKRKTRKELYLDEIVDQLMTTGLNDMSLRELAAQLGTSHRVLIYHFQSKENLISEAVQEVRRRERELFRDSVALNDDSGTAEALTAFFEHNMSVDMRPYFRLFYEVWGIAQANPKVYAGFLDGIVSVWVELLSEVLIRAGFTPVEANSRATVLLATLRGLQLDLFTTGDNDRTQQAFTCLIGMIQADLALRHPLHT